MQSATPGLQLYMRLLMNYKGSFADDLYAFKNEMSSYIQLSYKNVTYKPVNMNPDDTLH